MSGVNKVILIGRLGGDPELKEMSGGGNVCNFSMATSESWKDKNGDKQEKTEWHKIVTFNKLADICGEYLYKGKQVYIEGRIQTRQWDDKDGNKRYTTEIVAHQMQMLGNKDGDTPAKSETGGQEYTDKAPDMDDIPFS